MGILDELWNEGKPNNINTVAEVLLKELKTRDLLDLNSFANSYKRIISTLYQNGNITDEQIENALHEAVIKRGEIEYDLLTFKKGCIGFIYDLVKRPRLDKSDNPWILAYCIKNNVFSEDKLNQIPLKRTHTIDSFVDKYYNEDILPDLRKELLDPAPPIRIIDTSYLTTTG